MINENVTFFGKFIDDTARTGNAIAKFCLSLGYKGVVIAVALPTAVAMAASKLFHTRKNDKVLTERNVQLGGSLKLSRTNLDEARGKFKDYSQSLKGIKNKDQISSFNEKEYKQVYENLQKGNISQNVKYVAELAKSTKCTREEAFAVFQHALDINDMSTLSKILDMTPLRSGQNNSKDSTMSSHLKRILLETSIFSGMPEDMRNFMMK